MNAHEQPQPITPSTETKIIMHPQNVSSAEVSGQIFTNPRDKLQSDQTQDFGDASQPVGEGVVTDGTVGEHKARGRLASNIGQKLVLATVADVTVRGYNHLDGETARSANNVNPASLSILGLRRWSRDARQEKRRQDAQFYKKSAEVSLNIIGYEAGKPASDRNVKSDYDPLGNFAAQHRTQRAAGYRNYQKIEPDPNKPPVPLARTSIQAMTSQHHNARANKINASEARLRNIKDLYPNYNLEDKEALKTELAAGRTTRSQRKAIVRAGREIRRIERATKRSLQQLRRGAEGDDLPGRFVATSIKNSERIAAAPKKAKQAAYKLIRK